MLPLRILYLPESEQLSQLLTWGPWSLSIQKMIQCELHLGNSGYYIFLLESHNAFRILKALRSPAMKKPLYCYVTQHFLNLLTLESPFSSEISTSKYLSDPK